MGGDELSDVHADALRVVKASPMAKAFATSVQGLFRITRAWRIRRGKSTYTGLYLKPSRSIRDSLLIDREVLGLVVPYAELETRAVMATKTLIDESDGRVESSVSVLIHRDVAGDDKIRSWGRNVGLSVIPVYLPSKATPLTPQQFRRHISLELFAADPFQVTGPVDTDLDFFGRRNDVLELHRQLRAGRIRAIFGIRKIGKISCINRVIRHGRQSGETNFAMIDCSLPSFNQLSASDALRAVAKVSKMGATQGYAHISDALKRTDKELIPVFQDLWEKKPSTLPLVIVFDEVDYITPHSPTAPHWQNEFNDFWREFRVLVQEAQRHDFVISVLVSGVSSRPFRMESIGGVENAVLHFVPEGYLAPFARGASVSMLGSLGKRCGLSFSKKAKEYVAEVCGDFPFWLRMAGSHLHRAFDVESRPLDIDYEQVKPVIDDFVSSEGADIARVAFENLARMYPEIVDALRGCITDGSIPLAEGRVLTRYGLAQPEGERVVVRSAMVKEGLPLVSETPSATKGIVRAASEVPPLRLLGGEWAEELALLNRRRNELERQLREMIRYGLKFNVRKPDSWIETLLKALPLKRRRECLGLSADQLLSQLYWQELSQIVSKNWPHFAAIIGDKARFQLAMGLLNDRPDAHAKDIDHADLALHRRELGWLAERVGR